MATVTLTKKEVARRQLGAALEIWFHDGEPVAVHTLACAAHEIIATLLEKEGKPPLMFDPNLYKPGCVGLAKKAFHKHYNFFKHANTDPAAEIEFTLGASEVFLLMAIEGWKQLYGSREEIHFAYWIWFIVRNPKMWIVKDELNQQQLALLTTDPHKLRDLQKRELFQLAKSAQSQALQ